MPRDSDKNNDSRGRRDRPSGGKGRSGAARGPEKKFAKRGFAGKGDADKRPYAGKREGAPPRRDYGDAPRRFDKDAPRARGDRPFTDRPPRFNRDDRPGGDRPPRKDFRSRDDRDGEKRPFTPRGDARPAARFQDRKFQDRKFEDKKFGDRKPYAPRDGGGEKRPYGPRGEGFRKDADRPQRDRPFSDRPQGERKFGGDKNFSRGGPDRKGDRGDRGDSKPWQKRDAGDRDGARNFDKPRFNKPRYDKPRDERGGEERPRFSRPREDRPREDRPYSDRSHGDRPFRERPKFDRPRDSRDERPKFERPREGGRSWQEHPRSEARSFDRHADRPRRDNEDDSKIFAKRPAFGGRGAYRERAPDERRPARPPRQKKSGERIAKVVSRAGLASRRDAEEWIVQGRVTVNGRVINSPALDVTANDVITVDGKPLPPRERTRLFLFHKPRGLMTTHADPEGRPTVFDNLPEGLPRLISIGRLDFNTEGLLLLTNDGGLARALELPETGWLRR
jgi:23S rRNA pseudouridine2605 synthase